jgi:hypothetical protein
MIKADLSIQDMGPISITLGKNVLVRNIALTCSKIFHRDMKPIYLPWKENNNSDNETHNLSGINNHSCENYSREASKSQTSKPLHKSRRLKKPLLNKHDFLW